MRNKFIKLAGIGLASSMLFGCFGTDGGDNPPTPNPIKLKGSYVLSGTFGAITNKKIALQNGKVLGATDDSAWKELPLGGTSIRSYVYAKDRFVTGGVATSNGRIGGVLYSFDGINWYNAKGEYEYSSQPSGVVYFDAQNQKFIAPSAQSVDGVSWSSFDNQGKVPMVFGNNRYLSLGLDYSYKGYYSLDNAQTWLTMANTPTGVTGMTTNMKYYFNGSQFISFDPYNATSISTGTSAYFVSNDGNIWQTQNYPLSTTKYSSNIFCSIAKGNGIYFCGFNLADPGTLNATNFSTSTDGITWSDTKTLVTNGESVNMGTLIFVNNKYYTNCSSYDTNGHQIKPYKACVSNDGQTWNFLANTPVEISNIRYSNTDYGTTTTTPYFPSSLTYAYGKYFLFGDNGRIWYSTDMTNWTQTVSGITVSGYNTFSNTSTQVNSFVLGTMLDETASKYLSIAYSDDNSASFKMASVPNIRQTPRAIASSGTDFVVVGDAGTLLHSNDGITWTQIDVSGFTTSDLTNVEYLNGKYYVVGDLGFVLSSSNGVNWTSSQVAGFPRLMDIIYTANNYYVVGYGGYIGYSANTSNWRTATTPNKNQINSIAFGGGVYVAVGNSATTGTPATLLISTDGQQFASVDIANVVDSSGEPVASLPTSNLNNVLYDSADGFVVVGDNGVALTSTDGIHWVSGNLLTYSYQAITELGRR